MTDEIDWQALAKIELHLHLEGAAPPDFIRRIADEKNHRLDGVFSEDGGYSYKDFNHFLQVYEAATSVLTGPEDFARLVRAVIHELAEQGVRYAEVFVSPEFCGGGDLVAWRDYLAALEAAALEGERSDGVILKGIVTAIRHFGPERARASAICAAETYGGFIRGFGMAGDEMQGAPKDFTWSFDCAREAGLGLTVHAGEWGGAASVCDALDALRPARIGHGVQAIDDPALVARLAETGITLECCPGSNVFLGVYPSLATHPIERLRSEGVAVTVSTDDPPFFNTTLNAEYRALAETFDWTQERFAEINHTALAAAFCDEDTRSKLAKILESPA